MFASLTMAQVNPKQMSVKVLESLSSQQTGVPFVMVFDDFCAMYVCFRDQKDDEIMQVTF
jgi:hypothetical protein